MLLLHYATLSRSSLERCYCQADSYLNGSSRWCTEHIVFDSDLALSFPVSFTSSMHHLPWGCPWQWASLPHSVPGKSCEGRKSVLLSLNCSALQSKHALNAHFSSKPSKWRCSWTSSIHRKLFSEVAGAFSLNYLVWEPGSPFSASYWPSYFLLKIKRRLCRWW